MTSQTIFAAAFSNGWMKMSTQERASSTEESNIHGRALPAPVRVRSTSCPAMRLPMTMRMADRMGKSIRNVSTVPASAEPAASSSANNTSRK